jgi:ribonuclease HI
MVSDSQYLIRGIREWVPGWRSRGWTRKGGPIENLALWQRLVRATEQHEVQWTWVRGHAGHAKNEYANDLAVAAATSQDSLPGVTESGFDAWLARQREKKKKYLDYDPDVAFTILESRVKDNDRFALME